jgi:hypothetical protein
MEERVNQASALSISSSAIVESSGLWLSIVLNHMLIRSWLRWIDPHDVESNYVVESADDLAIWARIVGSPALTIHHDNFQKSESFISELKLSFFSESTLSDLKLGFFS